VRHLGRSSQGEARLGRGERNAYIWARMLFLGLGTDGRNLVCRPRCSSSVLRNGSMTTQHVCG
jgi:hypothetical protein